MARTAGLLLVLLASASIALGSPLCCLVATGCCSTAATVNVPAENQDCCSHGARPDKPAPKPEKKDCACKHDVATTAAEHAPLIAVLDAHVVTLPLRAVADVARAASHASPASHAPRSHPLLL